MPPFLSFSFSEFSDLLVPPFLPSGEVLGWNLTTIVNPVTKRREYKFTVCVQTVGAFRSSDNADVLLVKCDGPCGTKMPSNHLITMGKCDHMLCKACFGIVKNPDGSYGCSNFYCWSEPRENFRKEKANYSKIINKQKCRARKFKKDGEDLKPCSKSNLPNTPSSFDSDVKSETSPKSTDCSSSSNPSNSSSAPSSSSYSSTIDSYGLPKLF